MGLAEGLLLCEVHISSCLVCTSLGKEDLFSKAFESHALIFTSITPVGYFSLISPFSLLIASIFLFLFFFGKNRIVL